MTTFDPQLLAQLYHRLGQLLLDGRASTIRQLTGQLPELVEGLSETDPEALAAAHYHVLGREVPPYASLFCEVDRRIGGQTTEHYQRLYRAAGFTLDPRQEPADHLGQILHFLGFCLEQERPERQEAARQLLHGEGLAWLPVFAFAVARQQIPFMDRVVGLVTELIQAHQTLLSPPARRASLPWPDPAVPGPEAGLAQLAAYLTTPVRCGCYLSLADLQQIGRQVGLPVGVGPRVQVLETLLHTAALHGRARALLEALLALVEAWRQYLATCADKVGVWRERLEATRRLLQAAWETLD
ncbi:TorD/DmsD family molecular chaperone [Rhodothermus profundi]|uniref:Nitrate reductase delta subunit n=1 Tax=Rhodothermus profundi TaxID=633813 RepID=A0A1M6RLW7_9BACT|nr:molecular chaperone TorD family protein [Rhodothermus profundi]SHK33452.1 Nitrate reductase delta subunit [Rhodothermus profundi]